MFEQRRRVDLGQQELTRGGRVDPVLKVSRRSRHSGLINAVLQLDSVVDAAQKQQLADWIGEQYRTDYGSIPLGFVSRCYLGPPYVDHYLNLLGQIVEHFEASKQMPPPYNSARMLARSGGYEFVEVYSNGDVIPVKSDGTPV